MTGFGRGTAAIEGREVTVELKAVNSRYTDFAFHMPRMLNFAEERIRRAIAAVVARGKVDVSISYRNRREDHAHIVVDAALAKSYARALETLKELTGLHDEPTLGALASFPAVLSIAEAEEDEQAVFAVVEDALERALIMLADMRKGEGERLRNDLMLKAQGIRAQVALVETHAPALALAARERLVQKMQEYIDADETIRMRVLAEAALLADKRAVDEEIVRLQSHLDEFCRNLDEGGAVGRKLDFIVQEMNREINTIGSKASEQEVNAVVIALKSDMEKIREQIQNIE